MFIAAFRHRVVVAAGVAAAVLMLAAASAAAERGGEPETASRAITQEVLDALSAELRRAERSLKIPGAPAPYFIAFKVTEVEVEDVAASLGATTAEHRRHFAILDSFVRVGDYEFDNTNFVIPQQRHLDGSATMRLPVEASPQLARHAAWLATDDAYKQALEQMSAKVDALRTGAAGGRDGVPSYSRVEPVVSADPVLVPALEPMAHLADRARRASLAFAGKTHIRDSRVAFTSFIERRWYLNNEGTLAHDTRRVTGVILVATAQAEDGQHLALYDARYGFTEDDLPSDDELASWARDLSAKLDAMQTAPVVDNYTGPVLFEGVGAAALVRETLAPKLGGSPLPIGLPPQDRRLLGGGALADRIGLRVIAPMLSIVDDPTLERAEGRALIGAYRFDDEGVPAQRVQVVQQGQLESLLMSRLPSRHLGESNGHARLPAPGGTYHGSATNLLLSGERGEPRAALRRRLLREVREQGLDYGLVIRRLDDPHVTANAELSRLELFQLLQGRNPDAPSGALLAYRVYPDGREELVRGVQLGPVPLRAWRDVIATSRERTVFNYLATTDDLNLVRLTGAVPGFVPSGGVESAVVTPDLLFRELDILRDTSLRREAPAVPHPDAR
jgi:TldD protein